MEINPNLTKKARYDVELATAAQSGEEKAFAELLMRNKATIYFMLLRLVKNRMDAEELTMEAFGKAFVNIHQYKSEFAFITWISSIAFNHAIDHLRRKRVATVSLDLTFDHPAGSFLDYNYNIQTCSDNPEEAFIKDQNAKLLGQLVSELKPKYRVLLEMRYFKEYSYSEIAEELHLSLEAVKVQLYRSREKLLKLLKKSEINC